MHIFSYFDALPSRLTSLLIFIFLLLWTGHAKVAQAKHTLGSALDLPDWLSVSIEQRTRYETVDEQFRTGSNGDDQILVSRTNILSRLYWKDWTFGFEAMDSRQAHADSSTPLSSGIVNPIDILQLYAEWTIPDLLQTDSSTSLKVGRFTMDIGSRRFVARNLFRNTVNAFSGIDLNWQHSNGTSARVFYTLPVHRRPTDFDSLQDNHSKSDEQDLEVKFWGLYAFTPNAPLIHWQDPIEWFYFGLNEHDSYQRATRNRNLHTLGFRAFRTAERKQFDYQIEAAIQLGESRASTAADDHEDLDHFAYFYRAEVGYSYAHPWNPRLSAQFDYASGDKNPNDSDNERFDTLYGARRFDFGPTGIYGPFVRSNLISPGMRLQLRPHRAISILLAHRGYWLAQKEDAWVAAGVRDPQGESGRLIGQQSEIRVRWDIVPENIRFEIGGAYLFKGKFAQDAPNANDEGDSNFWYSQLNLSF